MRKELFISIIGVSASMITQLFGGWTRGIATMIIMMCLDWVTGLMVAGIFKTSDKSQNGGLNSSIGLKGICKKGMMMILVIVAHRFDLVIGTNYIRDAVIIALIVNESISLLENAGLMGIPIPKILERAIDILKDKSEGESKNEENK